ncbi:hypothetical protein GCM10010981_04750 [Dyella nitratireducens]|uniref:Uncharacterized protein n=1 Tax=Dyella nitratireducens TaxID=1849580 RepID=A0ABQ1FMJ4_9GAMM|nr:hypothetical protein GCM10010981_04750 [Dyella nitratireducens]GLQ44463.1 hypothetical protein GCM10007902_43130 [Dyella nitratireducens]
MIVTVTMIMMTVMIMTIVMMLMPRNYPDPVAAATRGNKIGKVVRMPMRTMAMPVSIA